MSTEQQREKWRVKAAHRYADPKSRARIRERARAAYASLDRSAPPQALGVAVRDRFFAKVAVRGQDDCWLWMAAPNRKGYGTFFGCLSRHAIQAHRVSWELHNGPIPAGLFVLHECDTPLCVNPQHLYLGTHQDNMADMARKGRADRKIGERNPNAKLTEAQVSEIRAASGLQREIAARYGVSERQVSNIRTGQQWRHLEGETP